MGDGVGEKCRVRFDAAHRDVLTAHLNRRSTARRDFRRSDKVRVVINAIHAKSGGGVTHLRNLLPHLADDARIEVHVFLHKLSI